MTKAAVDRAAQGTGDERVLRRKIAEIDPPHIGEPGQRGNDDEAAQAALDAYDGDAGGSGPGLLMARRTQDMVDTERSETRIAAGNPTATTATQNKVMAPASQSSHSTAK